MAEEKKDFKPLDKAPAPQGPDPFVEIVSVLAVLLFGMYILNGLIASINSSGLFNSGLRGLNRWQIVVRHTRPVAFIENPLGVRVININSTPVFNSPGEVLIGEQELFSRGIILQGPVSINGTIYWYVDYNKRPDGWVKETDIAYMESELSFPEKIIIYFFGLVWYLKLLAILISILAFIFIVYLFRKINQIRLSEDKLLYPELEKKVFDINPHWKRIVDHIESPNENDWRLAILEADIMLNGLLDALSLPGETVGEKLKNVEKSDFTTIDSAWEAHRIRNSIAHDGVAYLLNQREARRVIELYRRVFQEFQMI